MGVLFNNLAVEALSLTSRVTFGYVISTSLLLLLTTCDLGLSMFTPHDGYWITLGCVAAVAVGCAGKLVVLGLLVWLNVSVGCAGKLVLVG